ncbi:hypothetical protein [Oceanobacillus damuensis]|uniref:hypothetical protein n=1 Tax=Oceanobacillus damuensis TaxID=937928 RepID=UPI00082EB5A3|nr:hypothetical protein [Oceanobacillus damuensis]
MGRQLKGLLYFFVTDILYSLRIFWLILLSILVVSLTISYFLLNVENGAYYFGFSFPIYIYCAILGFLTVRESIPFSLKMGAVRKNLFISIGLFFLGLAIVKAVIANSIHSLTLAFTNRAGIHPFEFMHPAQLLEDTWLNRVIIDTAIMFFMFAVMFIVGLLFYKYGLVGGGSVVGLSAVLLLVGIAQGWVMDYIIELYSSIDMMFFTQMLAGGIIIYCISFLFLRKITTVKVK